ncbi:hypothetical protein MUU47_17315 [Scandinavium sp. H11S7]|uniref:HTH Mu-type domain-containing protein n=1 Tax=Scandinavium hiltneri TaxID=2926519 RepID=A0ABT2E4P9_9ENTR|nr:hypothetical protein [Scandinavium hiltneri]MCS2162847.1 hypothetical protein [Scandinavium hiltneri]
MTERTLQAATKVDFTDPSQWLTAQAFTGMKGMPSTARGARIRLEKLAEIHPEIKRKRTGHKGFEYHISAAGMTLKSERGGLQTVSSIENEQLNLWIQLFKTMKPASREKMLKIVLEQVSVDLSDDTK